MRKIAIFAGLLGALALPAAAQAGTTDRQNAAQECRFERGTTAATREAFALKYGTNGNKANAFGKCVSKLAREERVERAKAKTGAPQVCRVERGTTAESEAAFTAKYGTNGKGKNAFGKCVSAKARELKQQADGQDHKDAIARKSAAKQCDEERGTTAASRTAFTAKYGTNGKGKNAFGKCVSKLAKTLKGDA
ncbi:MAG: hypothetical protein QOI61_1097 [Actinomycetota bacterium]